MSDVRVCHVLVDRIVVIRMWHIRMSYVCMRISVSVIMGDLIRMVRVLRITMIVRVRSLPRRIYMGVRVL